MGFEKINELASNEGTGSHVIITNKIKDGLMGSKNKNFMELQSFHANIGILKRKRVDADYRNVVIEKKNSDDCFKMANDARAILKKYFSIK